MISARHNGCGVMHLAVYARRGFIQLGENWSLASVWEGSAGLPRAGPPPPPWRCRASPDLINITKNENCSDEAWQRRGSVSHTAEFYYGRRRREALLLERRSDTSPFPCSLLVTSGSWPLSCRV